MKLRLKNNSIRFRLTQSEVRRLDESGRVEETIEFGLEPYQKFIYALEIAPQIEELQAVFSDNQIKVLIPVKQADKWVSTSSVGMESEQNIGGEKTLRLLIEKDFACSQTRESEADADAFPHPLGRKSC